jgi:hypothetical protein
VRGAGPGARRHAPARAGCANRLRLPEKFAPPLGYCRVDTFPWRTEQVRVEAWTDGEAFLLAAGTPDQYEWNWVGFWAAAGRLRARPGGTLVEVRVRPRRALGPPLVRCFVLAAPVALALLVLGGTGWLPRGWVTDAVLFHAGLALLASALFGLSYALELVREYRRDDLGRLVAGLLEAAEVRCPADLADPG